MDFPFHKEDKAASTWYDSLSAACDSKQSYGKPDDKIIQMEAVYHWKQRDNFK